MSANLLEHIPDDRRALARSAACCRPGSRAVFVVPAGPGTYDYYDRFLGHERRYARGELAEKGIGAGLELVDDRYIASLLYPAFWLVKQRNRRRYGHLEGERSRGACGARHRRTRATRASARAPPGRGRARLRLPFGIRNVVVLRRPAS